MRCTQQLSISGPVCGAQRFARQKVAFAENVVTDAIDSCASKPGLHPFRNHPMLYIGLCGFAVKSDEFSQRR